MPGILLGLGALLLILVVLLMVVIESTIMQLMGWGDLRRSLRAALWMNIASSLVGIFFLLLIPGYGRWPLLISYGLTVIIERVVLGRYKPEARRENWMVAVVVNLGSYLVLILPSTLMAD